MCWSSCCWRYARSRAAICSRTPLLLASIIAHTHVMDAIVQQHQVEIRQIAARHGARVIRVFGSIARGDARIDSDIDLLIDLEPGRSLLDLIAIKQDLEDVLGRSVDVVTEAGLSPYLRQRVLDEAVAL